MQKNNCKSHYTLISAAVGHIEITRTSLVYGLRWQLFHVVVAHVTVTTKKEGVVNAEVTHVARNPNGLKPRIIIIVVNDGFATGLVVEV